jgi:integrase/recombinase XerD
VRSSSGHSVKKPTARAVIPYIDIDKSEIEALLAVPYTQTAQGRRDRALLLFLYKSGARAEQAARLLVAEFFLNASYVTILGKGDKKLQCPLWSTTARALSPLIAGRPTLNNVFLNRCGRYCSTH